MQVETHLCVSVMKVRLKEKVFVDGVLSAAGLFLFFFRFNLAKYEEPAVAQEKCESVVFCSHTIELNTKPRRTLQLQIFKRQKTEPAG